MGEGEVISPGRLTGGAESCSTELSADLLPQLFIGTMGRTCFNDICAGAQQCGSAASQKEYVRGFRAGKSSVSITVACSPQPLDPLPLPCGELAPPGWIDGQTHRHTGVSHLPFFMGKSQVISFLSRIRMTSWKIMLWFYSV